LPPHAPLYGVPFVRRLTRDVSELSARGSGRHVSAREAIQRNGDARAAEVRAVDLQMPTVGIKDVSDDGQAEAGAGALFVQPSAPFEHTRDLVLRNAFAVVFYGDRERVGRRDDADLRPRVMGGVFQDVAEHLGEIGAVER